MAASKNLTPEQRTKRARKAALQGWANTEDRTARTAPGTKASPASIDYWYAKQDPNKAWKDDETRWKAADAARRAYMAGLSFNAAKARRLKAEAKKQGQA